MHGLDTYDYGARQYDPARITWDRMDQLCEKYYHINPYVYCAGNPINAIDPDGCDTVNISYTDGKWIFNDPIVAKGDDVFNVTIDGKTSTYTFSEGEWGERVVALNLESNNDYTIGVYHVSGAEKDGTGYYVTPGGEPSTKVGSNARIPEGCYPILSPNGGKWRQPQVGGNVAGRGIRFHYGGQNPRQWTEGCFVLSSDYSISNGNVIFNMQESKNAVQNFDYKLGGGDFYPYTFTNSKGKRVKRYGSRFLNPIKHKLYLKKK